MPALIIISLVCLLLVPATAFAHAGVHADGAHSTLDIWTFDIWIVAPLMFSALGYAGGLARVWLRAGVGQAVLPWQAACFAAGWFTLAGALVSPVHWLGEHLFAMHMVEHEIVMAVSAPLIALARPIGPLVWAFPRAMRHFASRVINWRLSRTVWNVVSYPPTATFLHALAIWLWHAPSLFDATIDDVILHRLQHLSFFLTGVIFWWSLLNRCNAGGAIGHLFITMIHTGVLGALIALAPRVLYPAQTINAVLFGLTPLEDQQLAGLIMWIPAGTIYVGAALGFAVAWIRGAGRHGRTIDALHPT